MTREHGTHLAADTKSIVSSIKSDRQLDSDINKKKNIDISKGYHLDNLSSTLTDEDIARNKRLFEQKLINNKQQSTDEVIEEYNYQSTDTSNQQDSFFDESLDDIDESQMSYGHTDLDNMKYAMEDIRSIEEDSELQGEIDSEHESFESDADRELYEQQEEYRKREEYEQSIQENNELERVRAEYQKAQIDEAVGKITQSRLNEIKQEYIKAQSELYNDSSMMIQSNTDQEMDAAQNSFSNNERVKLEHETVNNEHDKINEELSSYERESQLAGEAEIVNALNEELEQEENLREAQEYLMSSMYYNE